jgi:hypothetical protein
MYVINVIIFYKKINENTMHKDTKIQINKFKFNKEKNTLIVEKLCAL